MQEPFLSIVVPAHNEFRRIGPTLEKIQNYLKIKPFSAELMVVDDASADGTAELLQDFALRFPHMRILRNDRNHGKGFSVRRGVLESRGEFVAFTDADLSAPIEEVDKLLEALQRAGADAAVGSRALLKELVGVRQKRAREYGGRLFNLIVRLTTGLKILDTQCGLKLFRRASTRRAFELQRVEGFGFDPELLFLIERQGGKIVEVPVRWDNNPATGVNILRDGPRALLDLVALRWRAARGKYSG